VDLKYRDSTEAVMVLAKGEYGLASYHLEVGEFWQPSAT